MPWPLKFACHLPFLSELAILSNSFIFHRLIFLFLFASATISVDEPPNFMVIFQKLPVF
jgi:hypothetical protein